ncbi:arabinose transporter [Pokkaliibacter sp. CJK22405]|uniref:arabinose transporter n=1 Tax=Pokkaliibacter sp. CJK22405 TaxID=3384615 RepID=UPI00398510B3
MTASSLSRSARFQLYFLTFIMVVAYLCVAIALTVVPVFTSHDLKLNGAWAGLAVGSAFMATLLTRGPAGAWADKHGTKPALIRGLIVYMVGSLIGAAPVLLTDQPYLAFAVLIIGRLLIGVGESLAVVSLLSWCIGSVGAKNSGKAIALAGAAMYGTLAAGGPIGLFLYDHLGFAGTMLASAVLPVVALIAILPKEGIAPQASPKKRPSFLRVMGSIWAEGGVVCLQGIGFALIGAFFALHFREQHWSHAGLGITAFGAGFVVIRLVCGHLPDRMSSLKIALMSLVMETLGQVMIWLSPSPMLALIGAFLTGTGCSMIFPAMGRRVVHRVEENLRATALGGFSACQDLAYGFSAPVVGLLVSYAGYPSAFLVGAIAAGLGVALVIFMGTREKAADS